MQNIVEYPCTLVHNGREFTACGSAVSDTRLVAYVGDHGILTDWHGARIGTVRVISSRPAIFFGQPSCIGNRYYYMRATLDDGRRYALRGFGRGMIATGKRIK